MRRNLINPFVVVCFASVLVPLVGSADPATEARYPYDPACPWGRIANGKGMITRCLTEAEARALATGAATPTKAPAVASEPTKPAAKPPEGAAPVASPAPTTSPVEPATPIETPSAAKAKPVRVEVGPIVAEEGELSLGALHKPIDRYQACVQENGGLSGASGEVQVHFLVRGERSRAEGVEVTKVRGVSQKAARCIADVIDRRRTGTPTAPVVGATLVIKISS